MGQVLIPNVPDDTIESYKERARLKGHSLEEELRDLLERNKPFTPEELVAIARMIRAGAKGIAPSLSLDEICEGLE